MNAQVRTRFFLVYKIDIHLLSSITGGTGQLISRLTNDEIDVALVITECQLKSCFEGTFSPRCKRNDHETLLRRLDHLRAAIELGRERAREEIRIDGLGNRDGNSPSHGTI